HIFHVGDSRIYRVAGNALEQLTDDHRVVLSSEQSYLGRALGVNPQIEIDYRMLEIEKGDVFVLATDGVYAHVGPRAVVNAMMEEWVARRINSAHVLKPRLQSRRRSYLYVVTEFIDGQTLTQWMIDHRKPDLETIRGIVEQIAKGLQAFHRLEMLHQDIRPDNIMIDKTGTVKIIDFGATRVAGISEIAAPLERSDILGTEQYTAPEYFLGEAGSA